MNTVIHQAFGYVLGCNNFQSQFTGSSRFSDTNPAQIKNALVSDKALEAKFFDLADGILPAAQARQLAQACWTIEKSPDAGALARQASI